MQETVANSNTAPAGGPNGSVASLVFSSRSPLVEIVIVSLVSVILLLSGG